MAATLLSILKGTRSRILHFLISTGCTCDRVSSTQQKSWKPPARGLSFLRTPSGAPMNPDAALLHLLPTPWIPQAGMRDELRFFPSTSWARPGWAAREKLQPQIPKEKLGKCEIYL